MRFHSENVLEEYRSPSGIVLFWADIIMDGYVNFHTFLMKY